MKGNAEGNAILKLHEFMFVAIRLLFSEDLFHLFVISLLFYMLVCSGGLT